MSDPPPAPAAAPAQDPAPVTTPTPDQIAPAPQPDPSQPVARDAFGQAQPAQQQQAPPAQAPKPAYGLPPQVTLKPGTFLTMRINQPLASNKNAVGDTFTGVLTQPVVVNGIVIAQRGQTVYGRVTQADKVKGVSHLGVQLTSLTLADGSQATVQTQLVSRQGPTMPGSVQAGVITSTTATGAVVGAIAGGGAGAAAGAGIGAGAGIAAVLATRNHPSVIYPETMLTFQTENPVTVNTANAGAFRYVSPDDYARPMQNGRPMPSQGYVSAPGYPYPYSYPYPYPYWGYPYWGPSLWIGGGFYGGGWGGFRGFRR